MEILGKLERNCLLEGKNLNLTKWFNECYNIGSRLKTFIWSF